MPQTRQPAAGPQAGPLRRLLLPPALCGFLVLLVLVFVASYAVGKGVGPVAPGMHGRVSTQDGHGGGGADIGGMDGMDGMDMDHGNGHR